MFLVRYRQIILILTIGIGLGVFVPTLLMQLPLNYTAERLSEPLMNFIPASRPEEIGQPERISKSHQEVVTQQEKLYAQVQDGKLSILQNDPLTGNVVLSGLDIQHWSKDMQSLVTRIEFHSLDEVQSFIDSMSEELWIE